MSKYQEYQEAIKELAFFIHSELDGTRMLDKYIGYIETLKELVDKETLFPKEIQEFLYKKYSPCTAVFNGNCPFYNQNISTEEKKKKTKKHWR